MDERYEEGTGRRLSYTGSDRSGVGAASAKAVSSMSSTAGKGLGSVSASASGMPKQESGESASAYGERLRVYRDKMRSKVQKDAIRRMP